MEYVREKFSAQKTRYMQDGFNLDLTYITERIIAMGYPATGLEGLYRNPMDEVARFLITRYQTHFLVVNASNREYDISKLDHRVYYILHWDDHHPCPFKIFVETAVELVSFLLADEKNVLAIHCVAGKGRTGSLICALLFLSGLFENILKANDHYLSKRNVNVTNSSQVRYLLYFGAYMGGGRQILNFRGASLTHIFLFSRVKNFFMGNKFRLCIEDVISKKKNFSLVFDGSHIVSHEEKGFVFPITVGEYFNTDTRDLLLTLEVEGVFGYSKMFRVSFCTLFVKDSVMFKCSDLDDVKNIPEDFELLIKLKEVESKIGHVDESIFEGFDEKLMKVKEMGKDPEFGRRLLGKFLNI